MGEEKLRLVGKIKAIPFGLQNQLGWLSYYYIELGLAPAHKHFDGFWIVVVEEEAFPGIEEGYFCHVAFRKGEVEDVKILLHALDMD